ncbi:MAG: phage major capsid protein, partial [Roseobacter sp.]
MTYHNPESLKSIKAVIAAGEHLRKKDAGDPFEMLTKKFGDLTDETLRKINATDGSVAEVKETLMELDQKMARMGGAGGQGARIPTWGEEFIDSKGADIKQLSEQNQGRVSLNVKATLTTGAASGGSLDIPTRDQTVMLPKQRLTVRDLLNVISISTGAVEYASQTTAPTGAETVVEGALKPESAMDWELTTTSSKVIAHWVKASRQILEDAPQLRDLIDSEMRYGLAIKEESQLLSGDGTGANLLGMIPEATAYSDPLGTPGNEI